MPKCLISFGANIGDPSATIRQAADLLRHALATSRPDDFQLSRFFQTPPVGGPTGQPPFVNAVAAVTTERSEWEVWQAVRCVEQQLGRQRIKRWEARRIDLDILLFDDVRVWTPQLKIPHPRMCMRRFILEPALDVAADWVDPVSRQSVQTLADRLRGSRGNFVLCAERADRPELLLEQVARGALAEYRMMDGKADSFESKGGHASRWVAWLPMEELEGLLHGSIRLKPEPNLMVFLIETKDSSAAAWEDLHRDLAKRLRLADCDREPGDWLSGVARYMLATEDRGWAVHEMSAALEAMDCPVEPLAE